MRLNLSVICRIKLSPRLLVVNAVSHIPLPIFTLRVAAVEVVLAEKQYGVIRVYFQHILIGDGKLVYYYYFHAFWAYKLHITSLTDNRDNRK